MHKTLCTALRDGLKVGDEIRITRFEAAQVLAKNQPRERAVGTPASRASINGLRPSP
jgi:hypothetical protein